MHPSVPSYLSTEALAAPCPECGESASDTGGLRDKSLDWTRRATIRSAGSWLHEHAGLKQPTCDLTCCCLPGVRAGDGDQKWIRISRLPRPVSLTLPVVVVVFLLAELARSMSLSMPPTAGLSPALTDGVTASWPLRGAARHPASPFSPLPSAPHHPDLRHPGDSRIARGDGQLRHRPRRPQLRAG